MLDEYYDRGGRFIDTANVYATWVEGFSEPVGEPLIGKWMRSRSRGNDVFVGTKVGVPYQDVPGGLRAPLIEREVEKSLRRLGREWIDLLYAHVDDFATPQEETMEAFEGLIRAGKVRHIGASNFLAWRLALANTIAESRHTTPYCCAQNNFTFLWPKRGAAFNSLPASTELLHYCATSGVTLVAYWALLKGCYGREDRPIPEQYVSADNISRLHLVRRVAERHGANGNQIVLAWMMQKDPPVIPLITGSNRSQIVQDMEGESVLLSHDEVHLLDHAFSHDQGSVDTEEDRVSRGELH
jgi:aryl-alcohol dehydrogenase-like predicted oxidoreductase